MAMVITFRPITAEMARSKYCNKHVLKGPCHQGGCQMGT
jgi:hypothetical protein